MAAITYENVPDTWKHPFGPYRQGPEGRWWYTSFTTGPEPWKTQSTGDPNSPPSDFEKVFGKQPHLRDPFYQEWRDNKKYFKGIGLPEYITQAQLDAANVIYEAWGMGKAVVYEGRYGFSARWPESEEYDFDTDARMAVAWPHHVIPLFQQRAYEEGKTPAQWHPFVPPAIFGGENPPK